MKSYLIILYFSKTESCQVEILWIIHSLSKNVKNSMKVNAQLKTTNKWISIKSNVFHQYNVMISYYYKKKNNINIMEEKNSKQYYWDQTIFPILLSQIRTLWVNRVPVLTSHVSSVISDRPLFHPCVTSEPFQQVNMAFHQPLPLFLGKQVKGTFQQATWSHEENSVLQPGEAELDEQSLHPRGNTCTLRHCLCLE